MQRKALTPNERFADRAPSPATADFDLPAPNDAVEHQAEPPPQQAEPVVNTGALERAAEMLTGYAELVKMTGKYSESHYIPEIEFVIGELLAQHAAARGGKS